mmetsp:Transcript_69402/g.165355  ORF Transcript_69402/g.165355 Transcript_69402/m.165355 type:complete len:231 (-) Transcript_69402:454-1146(-)
MSSARLMLTSSAARALRRFRSSSSWRSGPSRKTGNGSPHRRGPRRTLRTGRLRQLSSKRPPRPCNPRLWQRVAFPSAPRRSQSRTSQCHRFHLPASCRSAAVRASHRYRKRKRRSSVPRQLRIAPSLQSSRLSCPKSRRSPLKEPSKAQQFRSRRAPTRARSSSRASPQPFGRPCTGVGHARRPSSRSPRRPCSRRRARRACSPQPLLPRLMRQRPSHKWKRNHSALHQC